MFFLKLFHLLVFNANSYIVKSKSKSYASNLVKNLYKQCNTINTLFEKMKPLRTSIDEIKGYN